MHEFAKAIEAGIRRHYTAYPEAEVYSVEVYKATTFDGWVVEVVADHFSQRLIYRIHKDEVQ